MSLTDFRDGESALRHHRVEEFNLEVNGKGEIWLMVWTFTSWGGLHKHSLPLLAGGGWCFCFSCRFFPLCFLSLEWSDQIRSGQVRFRHALVYLKIQILTMSSKKSRFHYSVIPRKNRKIAYQGRHYWNRRLSLCLGDHKNNLGLWWRTDPESPAAPEPPFSSSIHSSLFASSGSVPFYLSLTGQ